MIVAVKAGDGAKLREVRLRALLASPSAFGSTYAREIAFTGEEWARRAAQCQSEQAGFIAIDGENACGLVGGAVDAHDAKVVHLFSMWVDPQHRRTGVGRELVEHIVAWAESRGADRVRLTVTSNNDGALRFYERMGFVRTGNVLPYPNDASLVEFEMERRLAGTLGGNPV